MGTYHDYGVFNILVSELAVCYHFLWKNKDFIICKIKKCRYNGRLTEKHEL